METWTYAGQADSIKYYKVKIKSLDSILKIYDSKISLQKQMQCDFDKKMAFNKAMQDKKDLINMEHRKRMQMIIYSLCLVSFILIGFAFYMVRNVKQKA